MLTFFLAEYYPHLCYPLYYGYTTEILSTNWIPPSTKTYKPMHMPPPWIMVLIPARSLLPAYHITGAELGLECCAVAAAASRATVMAGRSAAGVVRVKEEVADAAAQGPECRREEAAERLKEEEEELVGDEPVQPLLSGKKRKREAEDGGSGGDGPRRLAEWRRSATPAWLSVAPPRQPLQRLVDACRAAFDGSCSPPTADVVRSIRGIMDQIGPHDVGLSDELRYFHETNAAGRQNPPLITCKNILQCKDFTIAVFFLPMGAVMPLHDHPGMTVFTKLLMGSARLEAYDWVRPRIPRIGSSAMVAEKVLDHGVTAAASGAWVLFPDAGGNMHRFAAGEDSHCAFLDVLAPPYTATGRRRCAYYRDSPCDLCACATRRRSRLREAQRCGRLAWLEEIAQPPSLRIGGLPYRGPTIF